MPSALIILIGLSIIIFEPYLISDFYEPKYLAWTGLFSGSTGSVDFYGFIPWSSAYIFGIGLSKIIFKINGKGIWTNNFLFSNTRKKFSINQNIFLVGKKFSFNLLNTSTDINRNNLHLYENFYAIIKF